MLLTNTNRPILVVLDVLGIALTSGAAGSLVAHLLDKPLTSPNAKLVPEFVTNSDQASGCVTESLPSAPPFSLEKLILFIRKSRKQRTANILAYLSEQKAKEANPHVWDDLCIAWNTVRLAYEKHKNPWEQSFYDYLGVHYAKWIVRHKEYVERMWGTFEPSQIPLTFTQFDYIGPTGLYIVTPFLTWNEELQTKIDFNQPKQPEIQRAFVALAGD